jgi:hypothetical protein
MEPSPYTSDSTAGFDGYCQWERRTTAAFGGRQGLPCMQLSVGRVVCCSAACQSDQVGSVFSLQTGESNAERRSASVTASKRQETTESEIRQKSTGRKQGHQESRRGVGHGMDPKHYHGEEQGR